MAQMIVSTQVQLIISKEITRDNLQNPLKVFIMDLYLKRLLDVMNVFCMQYYVND